MYVLSDSWQKVAFFTFKVYQKPPNAMATHPQGVVVNIVGIEEGSRGHSCEHHAICGNNLILDCVIRLRKVQIVADDGHEETAVAAYWVSDGVDLCRVGFLPRQFIKHADKFDGKLAQITKFLAMSESPSCCRLSHRYRGMCRAAIITGGPEFGKFSPTIKKIQRNIHSALYDFDVLSAVPVADDIVGLDGSEHNKKSFKEKIEYRRWHRHAEKLQVAYEKVKVK
jgi:hypothetical protein